MLRYSRQNIKNSSNSYVLCLDKKWAICGLFFFYFRLFYKQLAINMFYKSCQWLDSNPGPLVSEATALPTVQPLPFVHRQNYHSVVCQFT